MRWGVALCVAALILGGGLAVTGYLRMTGVGDRIGGYPAVAAGGTGTVTFDSAGGKTAYYEATCFDCDGPGGTDVPALQITTEEGDPLEVEAYGTDGAASPQHSGGFLSYHRGRFTGEPEYTFHIPEPGTYQVEVARSAAGDGRMRLGPSIVPVWFSGLALIVGGVVAGGALLATGAVVVAVTTWQRRRRARLPAPPAGSPPPENPPPGSPAPGPFGPSP